MSDDMIFQAKLQNSGTNQMNFGYELIKDENPYKVGKQLLKRYCFSIARTNPELQNKMMFQLAMEILVDLDSDRRYLLEAFDKTKKVLFDKIKNKIIKSIKYYEEGASIESLKLEFRDTHYFQEVFEKMIQEGDVYEVNPSIYKVLE